ncbi:MAG: hypothetical protein GYB66_05390 [Chloroflexi bacterium]|nr:hypothetical protein [Chloroflexota bacterium]
MLRPSRRLGFLAVLGLLFVSMLIGCEDSDADEGGAAEATPNPTLVPWQRAGTPLSLENVTELTLLGRLDAHETTVVTLSFSSDSSFLATANLGNSPRIRVWNLASGRSVLDLENIAARWLLFGPESETFLTISQDQEIQEWSLFDQTLRQTLTAQNASIGTVDQTTDQQRIAIGGRLGRIYLFTTDPLTSEGFIEAHPIIPVQLVRFTPDGSQVVSLADGGSVKLWDFATGELVHDFGRFDPVPSQVAISPDGSLLAIAKTTSIELWDINEFSLLRTVVIRNNAAAVYLEFSQDGSTLIGYGAGDAVSLWDVETADLLVELPGHGDGVVGVVPALEEDLLISGARQTNLFLWDMAPLEQITTADEEVELRRRQIAPTGVDVYRLAWSPDRRWIAFTDTLGRVYIMGVPE